MSLHTVWREGEVGPTILSQQRWQSHQFLHTDTTDAKYECRQISVTLAETLNRANVLLEDVMTNGKFVAYYRVSTAKQGASGLGLEAQQEAVRSYLNGGRWKMVAEATEIESGRNSNRPKLIEALALCRVHSATLIIAKLDRLARNVAFISNLMESGVEFTAVDFPQANRLTIHILAAVAEHEAGMISARTKAALGAAKARGVRLGNPTLAIASKASEGAAASALVRTTKAKNRSVDLLPIVQEIRLTGMNSLREIAYTMNQRGIPAARGGLWSAVQIQRILKAR